MGSLHKNIQLMLQFLKGPFLILNFFYYTLMTFLMILCDDTTPYCRCDQASDLWEQLELASELEYDLRDTVEWGRKQLVDCSAGKDHSNNTGGIDVKIDGSVLEENSSFKVMGLTSSSKFDGGSYIISIAKTSSKKIGDYETSFS